MRREPLLCGLLAAAVIAGVPALRAMDVTAVRKAMASTPAKDGAGGASAPATVIPAAGAAITGAQERLTRTNTIVQAIRQMQLAARDLARSGTNNLKPNLPAVPTNSFGQPNGLIVADGVPKDLANLSPDEIRSMWSGASLPTVVTQTVNGTTTSTVTIKQDEQQAVLNWKSFNLGKDTTLAFDQSSGGANVGRWTAFNVVRDPSGRPSQILGALRTIGPADAQGAPQVGGQIYVLNTNGIIFGGSSQVNAHALVASALPLSHNVLQSGLLNNPDTQFQFSALPVAAGANGPTPVFDPQVGSSDGAIPAQISYAANGHYGDVEVQAGALLQAPTSVDKVGGRIALIGANVSNAGTISTPNGQTILAAGLQVGLAASRDPGLRGLNVYLGAEADYSGTAGNVLDTAHPVNGQAVAGLIDGRGDDGSIADAAVTIVGKNVNQLGAIDVSTSVSLNGRVDLLAEYNAAGNSRYQPGLNFPEFLHQATDGDISTGVVTLGAGSVTRILPEVASEEKIVGTSLKLPSEVNLRGQAIHFAAGSDPATGAMVLAPSGQVTADAGQWSMNNGFDVFVHTTGQIYLDAGASIDVSGSRDVAASVEDNIVEVELRGPQMADYPLLRDGPLRGQTIKVDVRQTGTFNGRSWIGTPLADASGYVGLVQHTIGQLTTAGGSVALNAGGSVVLGSKSAIDVSGGWINYAGGDIETSKVISGGRVYDIAQATPDRVYSGIYAGVTETIDPKWGITSLTLAGYPLKTYDPGYQQGGSGGSVSITAPAMVLDGGVSGRTVAGSLQRTSAGQLAKTYGDSNVLAAIQAVQAIPKNSQLNLAFEQEYLPTNATLPLLRSPTAPKVVLTDQPVTQAPVAAFPSAASGQVAADLGKRGATKAEVDVPTAWFGATTSTDMGGFGVLAVRNGDGDIAVVSNFKTLPGGALSLDGANVSIAPGVSIAAPAGSLSFTAHDYSPYAYQAQVAASDAKLPAPDDTRGKFTLGTGGSLSTAGLIVDDRSGAATAGTGGFFSTGYRLDDSGAEVDAVSVSAYRIDLADNTQVDVSGGVVVGATGKTTFGGAGRVSLLGVLDPQSDNNLPIGQVAEGPTTAAAKRGYLRFNPDKVRFIGYAGIGAKSGTVSLQAQQIQIEDAASRAAGKTPAGSPAVLDPTGTLVISPEFFGRDGIGNYSLTGLGSVARDAQGNPLSDPNGPGLLYAPGIYVAPSIAGATGQTFSTAVNVQPVSWVANVGPAKLGPVTLAPAAGQYPTAARAATSLKLSAPGITYSAAGASVLFTRGDVKIGAGSSINLDPKGAINVSAGTIQLDGSLTAAGGSISIAGANAYLVAEHETVDAVLPTVELGATSRLDVSGAVLAPASLALPTGVLGDANTGAVLDGGSVVVQGNVVARKNAVIDVSGASGVLDLLPQYSGASAGGGFVPTRVESNGGSINLKGGQVLVSNATLRGAAGGAGTQGGSLTVSSGYYLKPAADGVAPPTTPADVSLEVTQSGPLLSTAASSLLGRPLLDAAGKSIDPLGHFAVTDFWTAAAGASVGGLASLTLDGSVRFVGDVKLGADRSLTVASGGFIYSAAGAAGTGQAVILTAPVVTLGVPFVPPIDTDNGTLPQTFVIKDGTTPYYKAPTAGKGTLDVQAERLIALGTLSFQGFSTANFRTTKAGVPVAGDIRGDGTVDIAGAMQFTAGQIYPPTGVNFMLAAYDHPGADGVTVVPGSIMFNPVLDPSGAALLPPVPLSAGGNLTVYASEIVQNGVLRAPFGTINLGWNGVGTAPSVVTGAPADLLAGPAAKTPITAQLTLGAHSVTSVSAVDPKTGTALTIPYGYSTDGINWFDPAGNDITALGPPTKNVRLSAQSVSDLKGSVVDVSGGGDLYAYRWVPGVGGTRDVLDPTYLPNPQNPNLRSYAVIPGYASAFAPYAPFGASATEKGYVSGGTLAPGDVVHLDLGDGNGARDYTLLPARYALLPGAYLVTPVGGVPPGKAVAQPDGSAIVAGYRTNALSAPASTPVLAAFEVARGGSAPTATDVPPPLVRTRAQYLDFFANSVFAQTSDPTVPAAWRLPRDAGYLRLTAAAGGTLSFDGSVSASVPSNSGGRGGVVDLSSPTDILVVSSQTTAAETDQLTTEFDLDDPLILRASTLNQFGAESLLLGGYRTTAVNGTRVTVDTGTIAMANAGEAVTGSDVVLAANHGIVLDKNAALASTGAAVPADTLLLGRIDATTGTAVAGSGNGALLRVSSDSSAQIQRSGADQSTVVSMMIADGAKLGTAAQGSVILDSTNATTLSPLATIAAAAVSLNSGQVSIQFPGAGDLRIQPGTKKPTTGLVLTGTSLDALQKTGASLSLLSYSSLDFYGTGQLGAATSDKLALHAPEIHGDGGVVTVRARNITLDNSSTSAAVEPLAGTPSTKGSLLLSGESISLGAGPVLVEGYQDLQMEASSQVKFAGSGSIATEGNLSVASPLVTGKTGASQAIAAAGNLVLAGTPSGNRGDGLGASLTLTGAAVSVGNRVDLASGTLNLHSTGTSGIKVTGTLDVSGAGRAFYDLVKYTDGGSISLVADKGDVALADTSVVNVSGATPLAADSAHAGQLATSGGGQLNVSAVQGALSLAGKLSGNGAVAGQGAAFGLDVGALGAGGSLAKLTDQLGAGGFDQSIQMRVRSGDVLVDGDVAAHTVALSADSGSITVTGKIDASGATGGAIDLDAHGAVTVASSAVLDASGDDYNSAGKGGSIQLGAGTSRFNSAGQAELPASGAAVDLQGTVNLGVGVSSLDYAANASITFPDGVNQGNAVVFSSAGSYGRSDGKVVSFAGGESVTLPPGTTVVLAAAGTARMNGSGEGGSISAARADGSTVRLVPGAGSGAATKAMLADASLGRNSGTLRLRAPQVDAGGNPLAVGAAAGAGVDVAVKPLGGSVNGASSIVVEGYRAYVPPAGVVDTVENAVRVDGTAFAALAGTAATPGAIRNRLLGAQPGLAAILHVQPGAEIINPSSPATTVTTLNAATTNNTVLMQAGGSFTFGGLVNATGRIVSSSGTGRILLADGTVTPLLTTSAGIALPAGATVVLDSAGVVTLAVTASGSGTASGTLQLQNGATLGSSSGGSMTTGAGTTLTLNTTNQSAVTVRAGAPVVMLNGGRARFSSAGSYRGLDGTVTSFNAAANLLLPAGATVSLTSDGTITAGSAAVQLAVGAGSFSFTRSVTMSPAAGDLRLQADWDLSGNRYAGEPGNLTLRAAGSLVFNGALSDGFASAAYDAPLLAAGNRSTSYRLVAGADLAAADFRRVQPLASLTPGTGSILIGQTGSGVGTPGDTAQTKDFVKDHFQVIRTGTGDITLAAGRDVLLLNQFATVYTAGTAVADPTLGGTFDLPVLDQVQFKGSPLGSSQQDISYPAQFALAGGDVVVSAQGDIAHKSKDGVGRLIEDSEQQMPNNWLYRRGMIDPATGRFFQGAVDRDAEGMLADDSSEVKSTAWWVDYSNFFEGIGALGGGNVSLTAGRDIMNVDAVAPTNARMAGKNAKGRPVAADASALVELGGGDVTVRAGRDINGGVYYAERGQGVLAAGRDVTTNSTRKMVTTAQNSPEAWLPTTLFVGQGDFAVSAVRDLRLGPVGNPFLLPAGLSNTVWDKTYFSTFDPSDEVNVSSLTGSIRLSENAPDGFLYSWVNSVQLYNAGATSGSSASFRNPWLRLAESNLQSFRTVTTLAPATLRATAYSGDLNVVGDLNLAPSPTGNLELVANGAISGLNPIHRQKTWGYGTVRLLDSSPAAMPGPASPLATLAWSVAQPDSQTPTIYAGIDGLFKEGESTANDSLPTKLARHADGPLHANDTSPVKVYTATGDISGFALMAGKPAEVVAGRDLTDISLVLQNNHSTDVSVVGAGRDLVAFAPNSALRQQAALAGYARGNEKTSGKSGRIEIDGPGTLEVLAGRNLDLGVDPANASPGIVSVGSDRNPRLPFGGADLTLAAGLGDLYTSAAAGQLRAAGLLSTGMDFAGFVEKFLQAGTALGARYLPVARAALGLPETTTDADVENVFTSGPLTERKALALVQTFLAVLRNSGRDHNDPESPNFRTYTDGLAAVPALFPGSPVPTKDEIASGISGPRPSGPAFGGLSLPTREIETFEGGNIAVLAPSGGVTVGRATDPQKSDQGILTERGGNISIYAADSVDVGTSRIFTLRGGYERIWSTWGNIAAGSGSKTVFAAPPTRVTIDAQSGDVQTDLAGLATGSGIGVLATRAGVKPDDVDLIAPVGTIDAGDAGIRASGNLNVSARVVLNAANIQVGGLSTGTPPPPAPPNLGSLSAANSVSAAASSAANEVAHQGAPASQGVQVPSVISVEVVGYGGDDESPEAGGAAADEGADDKKRKTAEGKGGDDN